MRVNLAFEQHTHKIYTRSMFEKIGHILYEVSYYDVQEVEKNKLSTVTDNQAENRENWCRVVFQVKMIEDRLE